MKHEKREWKEEELRRAKGMRRKMIERRKEIDDEKLIKTTIAMYNNYRLSYNFAIAGTGR